MSNSTEALTKPHATTLSMWKLYDLMERGLIDLDAEYQRDVVWAAAKMSHLIDSVLKNYYVPPVLFAIKQNAEGRNVRVCVDGKQRLTSIKKFMDNEIPHINPSDPKNTRRYYDYNEKAPSHKVLLDREREDFDYSEIVCIEYSGLTESQEQEIFSRVQLGVALTTAEKLQAFSTPMANFCRKLLDEFKELGAILDHRRSRPFHIMAQCLHITYYSPTKFGQSYANIQKFLKLTSAEISDEFKKKMTRIMKTYVALINRNLSVFTMHPTKSESTKFAPMEFLMFSYLINNHPERSIQQLEEDCRAMRTNVRANFKDIRTNSSCFLHMKAWIDLNIEGREPDGRTANGKRLAPQEDEMGDEDEEWYLGQDEEDEEQEHGNSVSEPIEVASQFKKPKIEPQEEMPSQSTLAVDPVFLTPDTPKRSRVKRTQSDSPSVGKAKRSAPTSSGGGIGRGRGKTERKPSTPTPAKRTKKVQVQAQAQTQTQTQTQEQAQTQTQAQAQAQTQAQTQTQTQTPPQYQFVLPQPQQHVYAINGGGQPGQQGTGAYPNTQALFKGYGME